MSASVNSLLRNGPVSSGDEGPPMFIISTAVFGRTPDDALDGGDGGAAAARRADVAVDNVLVLWLLLSVGWPNPVNNCVRVRCEREQATASQCSGKAVYILRVHGPCTHMHRPNMSNNCTTTLLSWVYVRG